MTTIDSIRFETENPVLDPKELILVAAKGREAMSSLYEYELSLEVHRDGGLSAEEIDGLLRERCFLSKQTKGGAPVTLHGVLRGLDLIDSSEDAPVPYRAYLVPRLWETTQSLRTRVYQDVDVRQLVDQVLGLSGLEAEWHLAEDYPVREYVVQYEETDFAFLSRQLEHWGIFYYFRQEPDGEVLVITDNDKTFQGTPDGETLTFSPRRGRSSVKGSVHELTFEHRRGPRSLTVRDYNYRTPQAVLWQDQPVDERAGVGYEWRYGDHWKDEAEGKKLARVRSEQHLNLRERYAGLGSVFGMAPGQKFELIDCPVPDLNITYLVTGVEPELSISGDAGDEAYQYRFTAVPLERDDPPVIPYRSQRLTPKPKILGFMHGVIDGEVPGMATPIDPQGRYKVILPMDSVAEPGGKASRWIRHIQPHGGDNYGHHFTLYIGTEVALIHLDGDPDRPVIFGSAPNPATSSPVKKEDATKDRIRTRSGVLIEIDNDAP